MYYKAPELLVDDKSYNYSLDIWSLGCMFAGMLFNIETFFKGDNDCDQLAKVVEILGMESLRDYLRKYRLNLPSNCAAVLKNSKGIPLDQFI